MKRDLTKLTIQELHDLYYEKTGHYASAFGYGMFSSKADLITLIRDSR